MVGEMDTEERTKTQQGEQEEREHGERNDGKRNGKGGHVVNDVCKIADSWRSRETKCYTGLISAETRGRYLTGCDLSTSSGY